ncbi:MULTISPECIES: phage baseplate assembly protein domain-containing protein [Pseudomonas]|uniref:phage baseplate assembly protein domain-containing protein n=1 Tax=Pseudomonas TaxID=286 RepID=UPI0020B1D40C|nr:MULTISPECIES: phage baseplate assembly protein [Pseudomonas]
MTTLAKMMRQQAGRERMNFRMAFRAVASRTTSGKLIGVEMEGLAGERVSGELFQHYGFTSSPLAGAEYVAIPIGGSSRHAVVVASEDGRYRLQVKPGEVALYTDEGDSIHMKRGRLIEVTTETLLVKATKKVRFEAPVVEASKDFVASGEVSDSVRTMSADRELYNAHGHPEGPPPEPQQ